ncbi:transcription factor TFIIIB component B'' homolog isoform X1 [Selaginella moellendorffii]|uniref:transcription factor TFIIIB component B'' homolog isoform X1 n=1 Tax=Selaginella moellendorffii TaxID=88036 RepID=UPI000D1CD1D3|nr:transcription factor TFIIIB component B'' homolog isoform X1 [Selaginella moellendorffii]|eukprot:XP_024538779.1 transcription factor TFIIIB component B'' homolog isoform X1 [Selaginella moellendorffii]
MLSSLQALNAAGAAPSSRSAAFQPKVKPRARKAAAADENIAPTQESSPVPPPSPTPAAPVAPIAPPAPVAAATSGAPAPSNPPAALRETRGVSSSSAQSTLPQSARLDPSGPSTSAGPSASSQRQRPASVVPPSTSETGESSKGKRKRASGSPSPRQKRGRSDINVDEAIDPATMTMKDIIKLAEAKERKKQKEEAAKKLEQRASAGATEQRDREKEQAVPLAPQVEVVDGKIVINQQSLEVDARAFNQDDVGSYRRIDETTTKLNYHSYMDKIPRDRWKPEETDMFYKSVQQFGTDFAVIKCLFPGKTRKQIKAKYKKEEKENPRRMSQTILQPRGDLAHYEELVNKLKAAAAAEATAEDEFDFTWDINATKGAAEPVQEDMANAEHDGNEEDGGNGNEEDGCSYEEMVMEETAVPKQEEERRECKPDYSAATPPPPALFAYETELPFAYT